MGRAQITDVLDRHGDSVAGWVVWDGRLEAVVAGAFMVALKLRMCWTGTATASAGWVVWGKRWRARPALSWSRSKGDKQRGWPDSCISKHKWNWTILKLKDYCKSSLRKPTSVHISGINGLYNFYLGSFLTLRDVEYPRNIPSFLSS